MADIISARVKINDIEVSNDAPITSALLSKMAGVSNDYIDKVWNLNVYDSSPLAFIVPTDVTLIWVFLVGGGGPGGNGGAVPYGGSGEGGKRGVVMTVPLIVVPGASHVANPGGYASASTFGSGPVLLRAEAGNSGSTGGDNYDGSGWGGTYGSFNTAPELGPYLGPVYGNRGSGGTGGVGAGSSGSNGTAGIIMVSWYGNP